MKIKLKPNILPIFTLGAGGLGLCLRLWLLSQADWQGLLPAGHIAGALSFILFALVLCVLFLCARQLPPMARYSQLFPADLFGGIGCFAGAAGIVCNVFFLTSGIGVLSVLGMLVGLAAAGCLLFTGYCRLTGRRPAFWFHCIVAAYFMLHLVVRCRGWGAEPQLQLYFFPFLAGIFLLLTAYQRATLDAGRGVRQWYVFFNQAALFCCLLASAGSDKLFYLTMAAWTMTNLCSVQTRQRRPIPREEEA